MPDNFLKFIYETSKKGTSTGLTFLPREEGSQDLKDFTKNNSRMQVEPGPAISFVSTDYFSGKITLGDDGLPINIVVEGVRTEDLIKGFKDAGLTVKAITHDKMALYAGAPGVATFYFEGDPKDVETKYAALLNKSVVHMTSPENLNAYEQKVIAKVIKNLSGNAETAEFFAEEDAALSEGERRQVHKLVTELSKAGVNYSGAIPEKQLSELSASTGIDPAVLNAASKAK